MVYVSSRVEIRSIQFTRVSVMISCVFHSRQPATHASSVPSVSIVIVIVTVIVIEIVIVIIIVIVIVVGDLIQCHFKSKLFRNALR